MTGRLAIVGTGRMGEAILRGVLRAGPWTPSEVVCSVRRDASARELASVYGVASTTDNRAAVAGAEIVVVGLKPAQIVDTLRPLADLLDAATVVSIAAGVRAAAIEDAIGAVPVVRAMPNTPLLVGQGMTALAAGRHATDAHVERAGRLFAALGRVVVVEETQMDAVTAVSGSGPAYLFLFAEALLDAAIDEGLPADLAHTLVVQTLLGGATMLEETGDPVALRAQVTSPGGTTEAAVEALEAHGLRTAVAAAVTAAHRRARELGA